jgi:HK97 family phage prohead protease
MSTVLKQNTIEHIDSQLIVEKAKDQQEGQFTAVLSTEDLDRHGEIVSIKGMTIPANQVIKMYYNHATTGEALPIGKWLKVYKSAGKLMGLGQIDLEDDFAVKVYKKILGGFIDSISIGFRANEYDGTTSTWTKSTLVEASVVAEPANVNAKITNKELGFSEEEFEKSFKVRLKSEKIEPDEAEPAEEEIPPVIEDETSSVSDASSADITEIKTAIEDLKSKQGALEEALKASNEVPSTKQLIHIRLAAKAVDKQAGVVNQVLKIKLSETK